MTDIFNFLVNFLVKIFNLMLNFKFDFFGFKVSVLSLELAGLVLCIYISFFKTETPAIFKASERYARSENKKDKRKEK